MKMGGGWVLEVDIKSFFDTIDHTRLQAMLRQRVTDSVVLRMIGKWLNAGVFEDGNLRFSDEGTPQGGVVSPLLANIYLHEVIDEWFVRDLKPRLYGDAFLIRYADDFVICFAREDDAHRVMRVLPRRMERYGLKLHDEKTRLVPFGSPNRAKGQRVAPSTFDFLGFTHYWGRTRSRLWAIKRKTARARFSRSIRRIAEWCRLHRHEPLHVQHRSLTRKMKGHYAFYGITGNADALQRFRRAVFRIWYRWLSRRTRRRMSFARFKQATMRFPLPWGVAIHSVLLRSANP